MNLRQFENKSELSICEKEREYQLEEKTNIIDIFEESEISEECFGEFS